MEFDVEARQLLGEELGDLRAICIPTCDRHQESQF
jgi:hypothetical protein